MNYTRYHEGMSTLLPDSSSYSNLSTSPWPLIRNGLIALVNIDKANGWTDDDLASFFVNDNPRIPVIYGLPKVHKGLDPLRYRPIIAGTGFVTQPLAQFLDFLLQLLVKTLPAYIRDTGDFLAKLTTIQHLETVDLLVTIDISYLYTSIPNTARLQADFFLHRQAYIGPPQEYIIDFVLFNNCFRFENIVFIQTKGTVMGSSAVPTFARRQEGQALRLVGSWNADCMEMQILDELETPYDQQEQSSKEVYEVIDNNEINPIICDADEELSESCCTVLPNNKHRREDQQGPAEALSSKIYSCKRRPKKKPYEKKKSSISGKLVSAVSQEQIRATTIQALSDVLLNRIQETKNFQVQEETVKNLAKIVEKEMFDLYHDTGIRYKNKYRSLIFNLKDPKNKKFFHRVLVSEITPQCLVQMSATEMAGQELSDWRNQERRHNLEIIEKAEKDCQQNKQKIKLTHKGLIEIETSLDEFFTLEDLADTSLKDQALEKVIVPEKIDTTSQHKSHLLDVNCLICMGQISPSDQNDINHWTLWKPKEKESNRTGDTEMIRETTKQDDLVLESQETASSAIWKGFIQMFSIRQFKVTAFQVSGYSSHLCQDLPNVITSKGFICPESVWEFVELIWPASTKDMCLLRLCPRTASDAVSYSRLFSYLNLKLRYGIIGTQKMEGFVIPLPARQPIPQKLHPLGGPGLEDDHPHLLLALLLPNHPSWTSVPKKVNPVQKECDVSEDIFSSILEDVEVEERQMAEQGLLHSELPPNEQAAEIGEVGMQELMDILSILNNNLQDMSGEAQINNPNNILPGQQNFTPGMNPLWPIYNIAPNLQPPNTFDSNPPAMFDPFTMNGPPNFCPF
ncbi:SPOC domain-containing protein 1 [Mantella aurantiaca]